MNIDEIDEDFTDSGTAQGKGHVTPDEFWMSTVTNNSMFMSTTAADPFSRVSKSIKLARQDIMENQNSEDRRNQFQALEKTIKSSLSEIIPQEEEEPKTAASIRRQLMLWNN